MRPPGMQRGGVVKKGKAYAGFPHSPTSKVDDAVSSHKAGGAVGKRAEGGAVDEEPEGLKDGGSPGGYRRKGNLPAAGAKKTYETGGVVKKRQFGGGMDGPGMMGGAMGGPSAGGLGAQTGGQNITGGLLRIPGRQPQPATQGPPNISGRPALPPQPLTVPMPATGSSFMARSAPGTSVGYSKRGGAIGKHDDEAQDKKLFGKMLKSKGLKGGGFVPKNQESTDPGLEGTKYRNQGKGYASGGKVGKLASGGHSGPIRKAMNANAGKLPAKTEL
jgi:hypothetical protein